MVFKGGTALKKCYFGNYRFSEDLDFTALPGLLRGVQLEDKVQEAVRVAQQLIGEYAPILVSCQRYKEKDAHPGGQEAFKIRAQFPKQREPLVSAMIEITFDESIVTTPVERKLMHSYEELINATILAYSIEEIVIEKLRAILQKTKKSHERSWTMSRARDYYDLWNIFKTYRTDLELEAIQAFLPEKCSTKNVGFNNVDDFFDPMMIKQTVENWNVHLHYLVSDLPNFDVVKRELYDQLSSTIS